MASAIEERLVSMEGRVRRLQMALLGAALCIGLLALGAWTGQEIPQELRTRALVILDEHGTERIVIGAPIPEPEGQRIARAHGMIIKDANGAERFGVGLLETGRVVMGFDAPPGVGSGRNVERLTFSVNERGLAEIRFLDSRSLVRAHMNSQSDNNVRMFIYGERDGQEYTNAISAFGDTVIVRAAR